MGVDAQMYVKVVGEVTDDKLKQWSYIFGSAFSEYLMLGFNDKIYHKPLERISMYEQDGPDIHPREGETFLNVSLGGRYYGEGYERGNIIIYIAIAQFLEYLIPFSSVYYGGDSSGIKAEPFDKPRREQLLQHYILNNGRDNYVRAFDKDGSPDAPMCPVCDIKMYRNGWGGTYSLYSCGGCRWMVRTKDGVTVRGFELKI